MSDTRPTAEPLSPAQLAELRQRWEPLGMDVRPLPEGWLERQGELARRARNRAALEQFTKDLHKITTRAIRRGLLTDAEVDAAALLISTTGMRVSLERSAIEAARNAR